VFDRLTLQKKMEVPITKMENRDVPLGYNSPVHYCPGITGGVQWNGPAYDEPLHRIFTGAVQWCVTLTLGPPEQTAAVAVGQPWTGQLLTPANPTASYGVTDPVSSWAGWLYSVDAQSGQVMWNFKSNFPFLAGVTATSGGLLLAGDLGGLAIRLRGRHGSAVVDYAVGCATGWRNHYLQARGVTANRGGRRVDFRCLSYCNHPRAGDGVRARFALMRRSQ